jgi:hypothetical protein
VLSKPLSNFQVFPQEDVMTNFAQLNPIHKSQINLPHFDAYVALTGAALLIVSAIAIYLAALSPGNGPDGIALMVAFP